MSDDAAPDDIARLLHEAAEAHHEAYAETDGTDPEWATWYAGHLQGPLHDLLGEWLTRSELTYLLVKAEREHAAADGASWPEFYARVIAGR